MGPRISYVKAKDANGSISDSPLIVTGVVYSATDEVTASEIRKAAYDFISSKRYLETDLFNDGKTTGSRIVSSFFFEKGDDYPPNSWIMSIMIYDPELKEMILKGDIDHFSFTEGITFSRIEVLKSEVIDTQKDGSSRGKDDKIMFSSSNLTIAKLKQDLAQLAARIDAEKAAREAQAAQGGQETVSTEKADGQKIIRKGFWHGKDLVVTVPTTKSVTKSEGCGRIWN